MCGLRSRANTATPSPSHDIGRQITSWRSFVAVYTDVTGEELAGFLAGYDLGELLSYKGIAEGVENSNFLVHTDPRHISF